MTPVYKFPSPITFRKHCIPGRPPPLSHLSHLLLLLVHPVLCNFLKVIQLNRRMTPVHMGQQVQIKSSYVGARVNLSCTVQKISRWLTSIALSIYFAVIH